MKLLKTGYLFWVLLLIFSLSPLPTRAEPPDTRNDPGDEENEPRLKPFYEPPNEDLRPRNFIGPPLLSFLLPGFDHYHF